MKFSHKDYISIGTNMQTGDFELFASIVNKGIDSHLEAFVKSNFFYDCGKYYFHFHKSEKSILLRRLNDVLDTCDDDSDKIEYIENWIDDINNYDLIVKN